MMSSVIISQSQDICDFLEMKCSVHAVALKRSQIASLDSRGEGLCLTGMAVWEVKNMFPREMVGVGDFL